MPPLFKRSATVSCFFCQSLISPTPRDPRSFRCPNCTCYNRFDANDEILSDEPAMHDESLNSRSFSKRASPSKDRLPTSYSKGPFCHTCQTNQMLHMNLLSNYLPPSNSPEYERRLASLPDYRESLQHRYPPVCPTCLPLVEDEIRRKNEMARTRALGGWLQDTKGKEKQRIVSGAGKEKEKVAVQLMAWRIRGCLWVGSLIAAVFGNSIVVFGYQIHPHLTALQPFLPAIVLASIFWTVWDPTYKSYRTAQLEGRGVRIQGKDKYITLQMISWTSRLLTSVLLGLLWFRPHLDYLQLSHSPPSSRSRIYFTTCLTLEIYTTLCSLLVIRFQSPPTIRLIDTSTHIHIPASSTPTPTTSRGTTPFSVLPHEADLLTSLSLSSKPITTTPSNPIFGRPSLVSSILSMPSTSADDDAMDWTPTNPTSNSKGNNCRGIDEIEDNGSLLRPQRFFPPEHPTGLEGLFAKTSFFSEYPTNNQPRRNGRGGGWLWVYGLSMVPLAGVAFKAWERTRQYT